MKKILFALLVLAILVVSGCKAPEQTGTAQTSEVKEPAVRVVRQQQEQVVKGPQKSQEVKEARKKAESVEAIEYFYKESEKGAQYYVMGNNLKIVFPMQRQVGRTDEHYDSVYVDLTKNTAVGYCEVDNDCDLTEADQPRELDINDFYLETPFDVLKEVKYGEKVSEETIEGKKAYVVKYELANGNFKRVWIWDYKGIPLRYVVETEDGDKIRRVDYDGLSANGIKASEVIK
jgi:hypothetical protein